MERLSVLLVSERELLSRQVEDELARQYRLVRVERLDAQPLDGFDVVLLPFALAAAGARALRGDDAPRVIALSPRPLIADVVRAMQLGIHDVVWDVQDATALQRAIQDASNERRLLLELTRLQRELPAPERLPSVLGASPAIETLRERARALAAGNAPILLSGPSGSGKSLLARALHAESPGAAGPFSSEYGADARFDTAPRGTLYVREVTDLSPAAQETLLYLLAQRGAPRVIAATSRDLAQVVAVGRFRDDLRRALAKDQLHVPALRERGHDVLLLAQHFLARRAEAARPLRGLTPAAARALLAYPWPGNVRELEACIASAAELAPADHVAEADLPPQIRRLPARASSGFPLEPLEVVERQHIVKTLRAVDGNKALAARILELDRKTLFRKLQTYREHERPSEPPASG